MGLDADVIAIGRFKKELAKHLDYPEEYYRDTPEGCEILVALFQCPTTRASEDLAFTFGISPWKFEEHKLVVTEEVLKELCLFADENYMVDDFEDFEVLYNAGFEFHYRPNG